MKIKKVHLENHPLFGAMDIDFTGPDGKALDTVVIAGINGTGKSTLLLTLIEIVSHRANELEDSYLDLDLTYLHDGNLLGSRYNAAYRDLGHKRVSVLWSKIEKIAESERPKIIYMPTEINFNKLATRTLSFSAPYSFENIVDQGIIENIPSFLATTINNEVYRHSNLPAKQAIDKVCNEINALFDILDIDAKMVGLNAEGEKLPIFRNSAGKVFDINHLSSGEKQLFVRAMALRMLGAKNCIILIDEPEISMHPSWQQRIVKVYEKIGENHQVIIATHSPHVVASVPRESVKLLKREKGRIKVVEYDEISGSYGLPTDIVLKELMELETTRDPDVNSEIKELWDMLHREEHGTKEFNERYKRLESLLGSEDEDLLLMRIEIAKLKVEKEKAIA